MFDGRLGIGRAPYCDCRDGSCRDTACRDTACRDTAELRALFHDLGNHLATFSCILETVDDQLLSSAARCQVSLLRTQTARMLGLLRDSVDRAPRPELVEVRALVDEIVSVTNASHQATVTLKPGPRQWLCTHPAALWRALANVVDNAGRAAGPVGEVEISVHERAPLVVIEVVDDGPGFGHAPAGSASLGLGITTSLTAQCGGTVQVLPAHPHGVRVRLQFQDLGGGAARGHPHSGRAPVRE